MPTPLPISLGITNELARRDDDGGDCPNRSVGLPPRGQCKTRTCPTNTSNPHRWLCGSESVTSVRFASDRLRVGGSVRVPFRLALALNLAGATLSRAYPACVGSWSTVCTMRSDPWRICRNCSDCGPAVGVRGRASGNVGIRSCMWRSFWRWIVTRHMWRFICNVLTICINRW